MVVVFFEVASACCLQGKNNARLKDITREAVASAFCLKGKNNTRRH